MIDMIEEQIPIKLSDLIQIQPNSLRSIQVESDLENNEIAESYVLTGQSRLCVARILLRLNDQTHGRSWTLTGPYGSGKSFFSLFLMNLVSVNQPGHRHSKNLLSKVDPILMDQIEKILELSHSKGLLPIPITGFRSSLKTCLKHGFVRIINQLGDIAVPSILKSELENWTFQTDSHLIIQWIKKFQSAISNSPINYKGIIIIFDEMGKPLEYSSTHADEEDVYLLQELAEFANRSGENPVVIIGILHQAFERYALILDQTTQREWAKVQGRFEDIAFQEPPTQQTRLLANAINFIATEKLKVLVPNLVQIIKSSVDSGWCPSLMKEEEFQKLCEVTYPFHPSVLVVLPYIFKRLAQNERSIFAYLASFEPNGFQEFIQANSPPIFLRLPNLFDYLSANFQSRLYSSNRARILTETLERLSTTPELSQIEIEIIKTIGLLNWLGEVSSLQANETLLSSALLSEEITTQVFHQSLMKLRNKRIIVFRKHNQTYAIWQGSDVDLDERIDQAQRQISGVFSITEAVQSYLPPRPIVARRHSFQNGTLRFFEVRYVDSTLLDLNILSQKNGASGLILLCLAANSVEISEFLAWSNQSLFSDSDGILIGISKRIGRLNELLFDLRCFHWIEENTPELRDDKVAQKELFSRINSIETLIQNELTHSIDYENLVNSSDCIWKYKGQDLFTEERKEISQVLSKICDERYSSSPIIRNELINRRQLSAQSAAARRNLIDAILTKSNLPKMGIEGYPPERSIYESLFIMGGLHKLNENKSWNIVDPANDDPLKLIPIWKVMSDFIFASPPRQLPIVDLYNQLSNPPFGATEGVLPVFLCAFLQAHKDETTLYRDGTLLAEPSVPDWEVLLKRPELFTIAGCRVIGTRAAIVERIAFGFKTSPKVMPIVRELVRQLKSLPEYAWKTNKLSVHAISLRRAIETAHSPEQLLFGDLPKALGLDPISENQLDNDALEQFFLRLNQTLSELATATPRLRDWARDVFLDACELPKSIEGWQSFVEISLEMNGRVNNPNLAPLVKRAAESPDPSAALESVLALVANRPLRVWTDMDVDRFPKLAQSLGRLFVIDRNGYLPGLTLTPQEKLRSTEIVQILRTQLEKSNDSSRILQEALQQLMEIYRSEKKQNL